MPINTAANRASALAAYKPFVLLVLPTGNVYPNRQSLLHDYQGVAAQSGGATGLNVAANRASALSAYKPFLTIVIPSGALPRQTAADDYQGIIAT